MKEKINKNPSIIYTIIYVILFLMCSQFNLAHYKIVYIRITEFGTYWIAVVLSLLYLYENMKDRELKFITVGMTVILINAYYFLWLAMAKAADFSLGISAYFCVAAFAFLLLSYIFNGKYYIKEGRIKKTASNEKMIKDPIDIEQNYIIAYYKEGHFNDVKTFSPAVMMYKEGSDRLGINIHSKDTHKLSIELKSLNAIDIKTKDPDPKKKHSIEAEAKSTIYLALLNYFGAHIGSDALLANVDTHIEYKSEHIYDIVIKYLEEDVERQITLQSYMEPYGFVDMILKAKSELKSKNKR